MSTTSAVAGESSAVIATTEGSLVGAVTGAGVVATAATGWALDVPASF